MAESAEEREAEEQVEEIIERDDPEQHRLETAVLRAEDGHYRRGEKQVEKRRESEHVPRKHAAGFVGEASRDEQSHNQPGRRERNNGQLPPFFIERQGEHPGVEYREVAEQHDVAVFAARREEWRDESSG